MTTRLSAIDFCLHLHFLYLAGL